MARRLQFTRRSGSTRKLLVRGAAVALAYMVVRAVPDMVRYAKIAAM